MGNGRSEWRTARRTLNSEPRFAGPFAIRCCLSMSPDAFHTFHTFHTVYCYPELTKSVPLLRHHVDESMGELDQSLALSVFLATLYGWMFICHCLMQLGNCMRCVKPKLYGIYHTMSN